MDAPAQEPPLPEEELKQGRATDIIDQQLQRATRRAEYVVGAGRIGFALAFIARNLVINHEHILAGRTRDLVDLCTFATLALVSAGLLVRLHRRPERNLLTSALSAFVDAAALFSALAAEILFPTPTYLGLLKSFHVAGLYSVLAVSSVRLTRLAAGVSIAANGVSLVALLGLDRALLPERAAYGAADVVLAALLFATLAGFTWYTSGRTRHIVLDSARALLQSERVRQRLGAYVSEEVAAHAMRTTLRLGGTRQDIAVLFSDLRGFTAYSEMLPPERLVGELNGYLDAMVRAVRREGGVVDKYIGDSIMAVFGVPSGAPDDAARALRAAVGMREALAEHNAQRAKAGLPPLKHGIGVHFGPAIAGNIGTRERMQYTVVGDTVNLASRLESATKQEGEDILVSVQAVEAARRAGGPLPPMGPPRRIQVRGHAGDVEVLPVEGRTAA